MAGTAVRRRLEWRLATVASTVIETRTASTIRLDVPGWPGHLPGQRIDVRLTAEDGYTASREYSIASAPGEPLEITVQRIEDGEVSPYLTEEVRAGDELEIRGPAGGFFVWDGETDPLLLLAGGSGIVPLRSILRHRARIGSQTPARLLYSSRSPGDVIYSGELEQYGVTYTFTRKQPDGWTGHSGRVTPAMLADVAWPAVDNPVAYVCGPTSFVEAVATDLTTIGYPPNRVRTERFG